jgi:hypothetical protein
VGPGTAVGFGACVDFGGHGDFGASIDPGTLSSIDAVRARLKPCEGDSGFSSKSPDGSRLSFMGVGIAAGTGTIGGMDTV